ncbi:DUF3427 domain-containing protein [Sporolactobacillus sp. KGMB 08714]|uniref:DUF3427 domain-containing protein n=1 Tax=Sporolactobacillus sp. KGMB 08714 TaxID=3064704 RepID=UPI002FBF0345
MLHAFERLNQTFDDRAQIAREIKLCAYDRSRHQLIRSQTFNEIRGDATQKSSIIDVLNYGLYRYSRQFGSENYGIPFLKLYEQYSTRDLGPLINFEKKLSAFRGSTIPNGNDYYLFIDLNKDEDLKDSMKYKDKFISPMVFQWETPNSNSQESKQGQRIINNKKYGINLYLFVRKFKVIDNNTEPFIYLGRGDVTAYHGNKPITTEITLHHEVPMPLYLEFTTKT